MQRGTSESRGAARAEEVVLRCLERDLEDEVGRVACNVGAALTDVGIASGKGLDNAVARLLEYGRGLDDAVARLLERGKNAMARTLPTRHEDADLAGLWSRPEPWERPIEVVGGLWSRPEPWERAIGVDELRPRASSDGQELTLQEGLSLWCG